MVPPTSTGNPGSIYPIAKLLQSMTSMNFVGFKIHILNDLDGEVSLSADLPSGPKGRLVVWSYVRLEARIRFSDVRRG
jgi:hypothetical protein